MDLVMLSFKLEDFTYKIADFIEHQCSCTISKIYLDIIDQEAPNTLDNYCKIVVCTGPNAEELKGWIQNRFPGILL
jgi:hypothetical protein